MSAGNLTRGDVMRADDVADLLGLSVGAVYSWARAGRIPHRRRGRVVLFVRPEVEAWLLDPAADWRPAA